MLELNDITERVIGCSYRVSNELRVGFLEKVYENALALELKEAGLEIRQQQPIDVYYHNSKVGAYVADLIVEQKVLVELKSVSGIEDIHLAQCLNYLRATGMSLCLLINFGVPKIQVKRIVNSN